MFVFLFLLIIMKNMNFNVLINMFGINLNSILLGSFEVTKLQHFLFKVLMGINIQDKDVSLH